MYDNDNRKTLSKSTVSYLRQWKKKTRNKRYQILVFKRTFSMQNPNEISWAKLNNSTERYSNAKVIKHTNKEQRRKRERDRQLYCTNEQREYRWGLTEIFNNNKT